MRLSHEERAERREQIRELLNGGMTQAEAARQFGLSRFYVNRIAAGIYSAKVGGKRLKLVAALREMASLGVTRRNAARLLAIYPQKVSKLCVSEQIEGFEYDTSKAWAPVIAASRARAEAMAALYRDGYTLNQIGEQYGLTRERVRQLMTKHFGMNAESGGQHAQAERRKARLHVQKSAKYLAKYGCTVEQWRELRDLGFAMRAAGKGLYQTPLRAFVNQRNNARRRKIGWELNLWQWWSVWQESGHWEKRGLHAGEYVMCRNGDVGPYALGNVFIALSVENISSGNRKKNRDMPIGVKPTKSGKFMASRNVSGKKLYLGVHDTPELAYAAYLMAGQPQAQAA